MNEPLRVWLEHRLGRPVEFLVGTSQVATGEALRKGQLDIAYLGPVTYVLQSRDTGLRPFARPSHGGRTGPTYQAAIIVPARSPVTTLTELRAGEIAMGDLVSTSGCWVPRHMLMEAGLVLGRDYERRVLGTHDRSVRAVARHEVAAGGVSLPALQRLLMIGEVRKEDIRVLAVSLPIPEYMWTFREGLADDVQEALRTAFIDMHDPDALATYRAESFIPAVDADVDRVRGWMDAVLQARLHLPTSERLNPRELTPTAAG
jgi:phosphonate transport system substrate-binding protein